MWAVSSWVGLRNSAELAAFLGFRLTFTTPLVYSLIYVYYLKGMIFLTLNMLFGHFSELEWSTYRELMFYYSRCRTVP